MKELEDLQVSSAVQLKKLKTVLKREAEIALGGVRAELNKQCEAKLGEVGDQIAKSKARMEAMEAEYKHNTSVMEAEYKHNTSDEVRRLKQRLEKVFKAAQKYEKKYEGLKSQHNQLRLAVKERLMSESDGILALAQLERVNNEWNDKLDRSISEKDHYKRKYRDLRKRLPDDIKEFNAFKRDRDDRIRRERDLEGQKQRLLSLKKDSFDYVKEFVPASFFQT